MRTYDREVASVLPVLQSAPYIPSMSPAIPPTSPSCTHPVLQPVITWGRSGGASGPCEVDRRDAWQPAAPIHGPPIRQVHLGRFRSIELVQLRTLVDRRRPVNESWTVSDQSGSPTRSGQASNAMANQGEFIATSKARIVAPVRTHRTQRGPSLVFDPRPGDTPMYGSFTRWLPLLSLLPGVMVGWIGYSAGAKSGYGGSDPGSLPLAFGRCSRSGVQQLHR